MTYGRLLCHLFWVYRAYYLVLSFIRAVILCQDAAQKMIAK